MDLTRAGGLCGNGKIDGARAQKLAVAWISDTCNRAKVVSVCCVRVCVCVHVHMPVGADRKAELLHGASLDSLHLSQGQDAVQGSRRSAANAHAADAALDGCRFAAPDGGHPSFSRDCRPGLGFGRIRLVPNDETGLEIAQRDDIEDVHLQPFLLVGLGMIAGRPETSATFGRLPHVLDLVPQVFWSAPVIDAIVASYIERGKTEASVRHRPATTSRTLPGVCRSAT